MENKYSGMLAWEEGILYLCRGQNAFIMMDDKGMFSGQDIPPPPQTDQ
jgi:hypothetical protein